MMQWTLPTRWVSQWRDLDQESQVLMRNISHHQPSSSSAICINRHSLAILQPLCDHHLAACDWGSKTGKRPSRLQVSLVAPKKHGEVNLEKIQNCRWMCIRSYYRGLSTVTGASLPRYNCGKLSQIRCTSNEGPRYSSVPSIVGPRTAQITQCHMWLVFRPVDVAGIGCHSELPYLTGLITHFRGWYRSLGIPLLTHHSWSAGGTDHRTNALSRFLSSHTCRE